MKTENITKAKQSMAFCCDEIREAFGDAVVSGDDFAIIVLDDLIMKSTDLSIRLNRAAEAANVE